MSQNLSQAHRDAVNRSRRVIVNYDTNFGAPSVVCPLAGTEIDRLVKGYFSMIDEAGVQMDSIWWCWLDGNFANYPSQILPVWQLPGFQQWWDAGIDPVQIFAEETKKRDKEVFFSYRLNGTDMASIVPLSKPLLKEARPEWLIPTWEAFRNPGYWNFTVPEVRDYKVRILREVAENYDYDGIEIDFSRVPVTLPPGHQWENRECLTEFMRAVRAMTLEIEKKRDHPFLLAARIPENLEGCHFDGMDVETWASEGLLDIFVLGNRSFDVDISAFRQITAGTGIKLYPCMDDHHASDGYLHPPISVFRGVFANWRHQGANGIQTFNFSNWTPAGAALLGWDAIDPVWATHLQAYREMAVLESLKYKDKTFVAERRGGGHGPAVVPNPEDWTTPRWMYFITNMFAPLPAALANDGKADTLLKLYVSDNLADEAVHIERVTIRVLLSDPGAERLPYHQRLQVVTVATKAHSLQNIPPAVGIGHQLELRLNNTLLHLPVIEKGWLVFSALPNQFAVGNNLIGLRVTDRAPDAQAEILIEKLEVHVNYHKPTKGRKNRK